MAKQEVYIRPLGWLGTVNKLTAVGYFGAAGVAAATPGFQPLAIPLAALGGVEVAQVVIIDKVNKKKPKEHLVYRAKPSSDERIPMEAFTVAPSSKKGATIIDFDAFRRTAINQLRAA